MIEDESDKYSYTVGCQHFIVVYWTKIVGFEGEVESLRNDEVAAEKRGEGEKSLLAENGILPDKNPECIIIPPSNPWYTLGLS